MSQHTPGPWVYHNEEGHEVFGAELPNAPHGVYRSQVCRANNEPDARLITAAPEILQALVNLLRLYQENERETTPEEIAAEYAIAKARGES